MALKLVIGNKNYSSWSMRPWLALRANNIAFEEIFIPLYTNVQADKEKILSFSHSGKVPALIDGDVTVWDSLAIIEYLAEKFPETRLWPEDRAARAHARSISAEMHSGFMPLRNECGMNLHRPIRARWRCRTTRVPMSRGSRTSGPSATARYGKQGPFLFGAFSGADAMYAPVVHRFRTYAIPVSAGGAALCRCDAVAAGVSGVDPRRPCRDAPDRAVRNGVAFERWLARPGAGGRVAAAAGREPRPSAIRRGHLSLGLSR